MENHSANYFTLLRYASYLHNLLSASFVSNVISLNKEEIMIMFSNQQALKIYFGQESFIFQPLNSVVMPAGLHPFPQVEQLLVKQICAHTNDRSLRIELEKNFTIVINLYGRNGNMVIFENDLPVKLFKEHENDWSRRLKDYSTTSEFSSLSPAVTPALRSWVDSQATDMQSLLSHPCFYLLRSKENEAPFRPVLSLIPLEDSEVFENPEEALRLYALRFFRWKQFNTLYEKTLKKLNAALKLHQQYCASANKQLESLEKEKNYRFQADLIMANLHQIPNHAATVEVTDFYSGLPVTIKLKENISPQKWAEKLYQKAKNQEIEKNTALENLLENEEKLLFLQGQLNEVKSVINYKSLKSLSDEILISEKAEIILPYRRFIYMNYEILVGKKSESNDRLTFGTAKKDDLFLHARDVAGSHVIVRNPLRKPIPMAVIEKAASLAAYYSKGKSSSLCPVSYTLKKYVRKPRNAAYGQVLIEKEKVILIEPLPF